MSRSQTQTFNIRRPLHFSPKSVVSSVCGRNLGKYQLGGVIFGCKNRTMKECQSKQLFGLPAQHFSYVKNIDPGLPLFLFNYSDRKLHGIFEASSKGQMYIDPYAWIDDYSELDRTQYPAQVKIRVRLHCQPLSEDKFVQVIADNYYTCNHFWFELDHRQTSRLMSLLASLAFSPGCNMKWRTISPSLPSHETMKEGEAFERPESETQHSCRKTDSIDISSSLDGDIKPLDSHSVVKEVNENEMNRICMKLKELVLARESQDSSMPDNANDTPDVNDMCSVEEDYLEVPTNLENKEESSSPQYQNTIGQLMQEIEELATHMKIQIQKNCYLEQKLREAELEIQHLKDYCIILESGFNLPLAHVEKKAMKSSTGQHVDPKESLLLKASFDGESWLSAMQDLYCPYWNVIKSLYVMNSVHSVASIVKLNVESYSPILHKEGSLSIVSLTNKVSAVDGANGVDCFSDTEVLDLDIESWISSRCSMLHKRFASAVQLNGLLFAIHEYNGIGYLKFAFGSFDGSMMVPSIEAFDLSFGAWMMKELMNHPRKELAVHIKKESIHVTREVKVDENIVYTFFKLTNGVFGKHVADNSNHFTMNHY